MTTLLEKKRILPRSPVLDWSSFRRVSARDGVGIEGLPHHAHTTSGRGAIYQALLQLGLPTGSTVLVPSYHCPTMVAPVLLAGLKVSYFGIDTDGLPRLDTIDAATAHNGGAMLVAHYFGLPRSLAEVRAWCDANGIALIEDCAHCYFGMAGDRLVGAWGDYSTASVSKFFPVPEAGLLASATRPVAALQLSRPSLKAQLKGLVDVFEHAVMHHRLAGINTGLRWMFKAKNLGRPRPAAVDLDETMRSPTQETLMRGCDMARIEEAPLLASLLLKRVLPRGRIIATRSRNYALYGEYFVNVPGARPLFASPANAAAPYVFPLWVDDADRVYAELRALDLPVFRWDRIWPGVPTMPADVGPLWSRHVLQLLCHQDLDEDDIRRIAATLVTLLPPAADVDAGLSPRTR